MAIHRVLKSYRQTEEEKASYPENYVTKLRLKTKRCKSFDSVFDFCRILIFNLKQGMNGICDFEGNINAITTDNTLTCLMHYKDGYLKMGFLSQPKVPVYKKNMKILP